jgi:hypothetical protein
MGAFSTPSLTAGLTATTLIFQQSQKKSGNQPKD